MKPLQGNELLVLKSLQEKPKTFSELTKVKKQGLSEPIVAKHLKTLQQRGLVFRNSDRKYELLAKIQSTEPNMETWNSSDLLDTVTFTNWIRFWSNIPETKIDKDLRFKLTFYFFQGTMGSILTNITKVIDDAAEAKNIDEVQRIVGQFVDTYFAPVLHSLAIEAYKFPFQKEARRPFEPLESHFSERAITAQLEFMEAYKRLEKTLEAMRTDIQDTEEKLRKLETR